MAKRSWLVTVPLEEMKCDEWSIVDGLRYIVYQLEKGEKTSYYHIQMYLELVKPQRLSWVKNYIGTSKCHVEERMGTREQARAYCMKEDTRVCGPFEFGEWVRGGQGTRTDLQDACRLVKEGGVKKVIEELPGMFVKYHRGLSLLEAEYTRPKGFTEVKVIVHWGDAGAGKTRACWDTDPDLYPVSDGDKLWLDGYRGEKTILIDDFYGGIKYGVLLKMLDGYPMQLPIKGGFVWKQWTKVYITSNKHPSEWYKMGLTPALKRRLSEILWFEKDENLEKIL